jgi:uncharacterized membrane protein YfcA
MLQSVWRAAVTAGALLDSALRAQAQWELEVSRTLLTSRRRLLICALLPVAAGMAFLSVVWGAELPEVIGSQHAYMPGHVHGTMLLGALFTGLVGGLLTGALGAGGGYITTPALMSLGIHGIMAVGTGQFELFAKGIMGTTLHRRMGNVNVRLAAWFTAGSVVGVTIGGRLTRQVYAANPVLSDAFIGVVYVCMLGLLAIFSLADWYRQRGRPGNQEAGASELSSAARWLQALPLPPKVRFDEHLPGGGREISVWPVVACGLVVGLIAAIMGVGAGFLIFPIFVYGMGVSTLTTVGTSVLQVILTTCYSSIGQYAIYGFILYSVAMGMLLGSLVGVQVGAIVTRMIPAPTIRALYAVTILAGLVNRAAALPAKLAHMGYLQLAPTTGQVIDHVGIAVFFGIVGVFAIWVLKAFFAGLSRLRQMP